jgi:hypothetical protein
MSDLVKRDSLDATLEAFTSFSPRTLEEAKAATRSTLMAELNHRKRLMTIRFNEEVIKPALERVEAEWNLGGINGVDVDSTLFEVTDGED